MKVLNRASVQEIVGEMLASPDRLGMNEEIAIDLALGMVDEITRPECEWVIEKYIQREKQRRQAPPTRISWWDDDCWDRHQEYHEQARREFLARIPVVRDSFREVPVARLAISSSAELFCYVATGRRFG